MDMKQQTMLTISETRPSQSGKTLGVFCNNQWYSTKCWELQNMVGQAIYASTSTSQFNGKEMHWINDYQVPGAAPGPIPQGSPMQQVVKQQQQSPPAPVKPSVDRDASIVSQTLCKTITFSNAKEAFESYSWLYDKYILWSLGGVAKPPVASPAAENEQVMQAQQQSENPDPGAPFDDPVPF